MMPQQKKRVVHHRKYVGKLLDVPPRKKGFVEEEVDDSVMGFPKKLPKPSLLTFPDVTTFNPYEKICLHNAWRVFAMDLRDHAKAIMLEYYVPRHRLVNKRFRMKNGKLNLICFHHHSVLVLRFYDRVIREGLKDPVNLNLLISELAERHKKLKVPYHEIKEMILTVNQYILHYFRYMQSPTMRSGIEKLGYLLYTYHDEQPFSIIVPAKPKGVLRPSVVGRVMHANIRPSLPFYRG